MTLFLEPGYYPKVRLHIGVLVFSLFLSAISNANEIENQILVSFQSEVTAEKKLQFEIERDLLLIAEFEHLDLRVYEFVDDRDQFSLVESLRKHPWVKHAESNVARESQSLPSDPYFSEQWSLDNQGQVVNGQFGLSDVDVDWPEAMDLFTGTTEVIVAVMDSGVAIDHPELIDELSVNWIELLNDVNGIDDDGNGYVDDFFGWDFFDYGPWPLDENGHGTLVASVIAAEQDNGELGVGVSPTARIMPLRVANDFGVFTSAFSIIEASTYAAENGARIINMSFGGTQFSLFEQLQMAWLFEQGVLVVAAAGNGGFDQLGDNNDVTPNYPANHPTVLSVAAVDRTGQLSSFSNFGEVSVNVAAPGTDIFGADVSRVLTYQEDFEGSINGWTQTSTSELIWSSWIDSSGNTWLTDSIDGDFQPVDYQSDSQSVLFSPTFQLGFGPQLVYRVWYELEFFHDFLLVSASNDGGSNWYPIDLLTGDCFGCDQAGGGAIRRVDLSGFDFTEVQLRFELLSDGFVQADGVYLDDINITEVTTFDYDGTQRQYSDGTSFAAPIVSGIASLIWSQKPELPLTWMNATLLSATKDNELEGRVQSGGVISAERALWLILTDFDSDGIDNGDEMILGTDFNDEDTDKDGSNDRVDQFPLDATEFADTDQDGVGDNSDAFPEDPDETIDTDGDGLGNNTDTDDDNDQMPDVWETLNDLDPLLYDADEDPDGDSLTNLEEYLAGSDPNVADFCFDPSVEGATPDQSLLVEEKRLSIVNPASNTSQQSFLRFVNGNDFAVDIELYGFDDKGVVSKGGPVTFSLNANASLQLTAQDLELGNEQKGIENRFCDGDGKWQVVVRSSEEIGAQSLIRTPDGFLTSLSQVVPSDGFVHFVSLANPASNQNQQTFLRLVNHSSESGAVTIKGVDDEGVSSDSVSLDIGPYESRQLTAQDLERGSETKGLRGSLGNGTGKWRLEVISEVEMSVLSLIRSADGFLTNLSELAPVESGANLVYFVSPADATNYQSFLRIVNRSTSDASSVVVAGIDDSGEGAPNGEVKITLGVNQSVQIRSSDLENGNPDKGLVGSFGNGNGNWRLQVTANQEIGVMSLVRTPDGFLTNLGTVARVNGDEIPVLLMNPGSNQNQRSYLRLINNSDRIGTIVIVAHDDEGSRSGDVRLQINALEALSVSAEDLELGNFNGDGSLGDGSGKWQVTLSSDIDLTVQSLLEAPGGFLTNLSGQVN